MTTIYKGPKKSYSLTKADTQMLARSLWGENGREMSEQEAGAVAWAMMQRFLLVDYRWQRAGWSFARFISEFSQPVNPAWADPSSAECQKHPDHCTKDRIRRRNLIQNASWDRVKRESPDAVKYAQEFADGLLPNPFPEPIYNFAAAREVANQKRPGPGINIGGNVFLRLADLKPSEIEGVLQGDVHIDTATKKAFWAAAAFAVLGAASAWLLDRYGDDITDFTSKYLPKRG